MVQTLDQDDTTIKNQNGVARLTIPETWARMANLQPGDEGTIAIVNTKHGIAIMAWSNDQPHIEDPTDL